MNKQPKLMSASQMRDIFAPHQARLREHVYMNNEIVVLHGDSQAFRLVKRQRPPFVINDYRMGIVVRGEAVISINLVERRLAAGTILFIGPGTIITPIRFSGDLSVYGVGLLADFPMPFAPGQMPAAFNGQERDFQLCVGEAAAGVACSLIDALWLLVRQPEYNRQTAAALVAALMQHYDGLYRQYSDRLQNTRSREQTIFDRFIYLVHQHCATEHHLAFYARKMCLTERYLGTVVRQASGVTAKAWLDRALVTLAKVQLRHTDQSVAQVAEALSFPNASFFCKYFRRLVGQTPNAYRAQPLPPPVT